MKKKRSLKFSIMIITVLPIIILGIVLTIYARSSVREGMSDEVEQNLSGLANTLIRMYDLVDVGDFSYENGRVRKGKRDLTFDFRLMDGVKKDTDIDVTICVGARRCLTTIRDEAGNRLVGSEVPEAVKEAVLEHGDDYFSKNIDINGVEYYGYYVPIRDLRGNVTGISFAGKAVEAINESVNKILWRNVFFCIFTILFAGILCNLLSRRMTGAVQSIKNFLDGLAKGDFSQELPGNVKTRRDELAEIGEDAMIVSRSLEDMVTRDPLTRLLNRRACIQQAGKRQPDEQYNVALGDIDFFKRVNDRYGHEMGDEVLRYVADVLQRGTAEDGFVSRWGGEEFLLVMESEPSVSYTALRQIREEIHQRVFEHNGEEFQITMTFGLVVWSEKELFERAINRADELLYFGKEHGRDQIVVQK